MAELSYTHVPGTSPLVYRTIPDILDGQSEQNPDNYAYVFYGRFDESTNDLKRRTVSFKWLATKSTEFAASLLNLGLIPGDRVAIFGRPSPEWLVIDLAALRIKVLLVRLPQSLVYSENLPSFLAKYRCKILVVDAENDSKIFEQINKTIPGILDRSKRGATVLQDSENYPQFVLSARQTSLCEGILTFDDISQDSCDVSSVKSIQQSIDPDDGALIFPTSGSTGIPKMVTMSQFNLVNTARPDKNVQFKVFFNDRLFSWVGSIYILPILTGCTYVHTETSAVGGVENLLEIFNKERVMLAALPVYLVHDIVNVLENGTVTKPQSFMAVNTGGEKIQNALRKRLLRFIPVYINGYGCAECSAVAIDTVIVHPSHPQNQGRNEVSRPALKPGNDVEIKILDDDGLPVSLGEPGNLWVRSPLVFVGYLDDPTATAAVKSRSGWLDTGDMAIMTPEKKIEVLGRKVEFISKGGVKLHPSTIEAVLLQHTSVSAAFVIGIPDEKFGEEVGACVTVEHGSDLNAQELHRFLEEKMDYHLGVSFVPVCIKIVDEFPILHSGKIDRMKLRKLLSDTPVHQRFDTF